MQFILERYSWLGGKGAAMPSFKQSYAQLTTANCPVIEDTYM